MARMTLKAVRSDGGHRRLQLSERVLDENLSVYRHVPRRYERLRAATVTAGVPESHSAGCDEPRRPDDAGQAPPADRDSRRRPPPTSGPAPGQHRAPGGHADQDQQELIDVAWLYTWSHEGLHVSRRAPGSRPSRGRSKRRRVQRG